MEKNCAVQYAKMGRGIFGGTEIVHNESQLTIDEAKKLWNEYFPDAAKWIKEGNTAEMVLWVNITDAHSYGESLQHISSDSESDGDSIWETKKVHFKRYADAF